MSKIYGYCAIAAAYLFGGSSLLFFGIFLFLGPFPGIDLDLPSGAALGLDGALCLAFFLQHSLMVRRSFQRKLGLFVPVHLHGATYAVASGVVLMVLLLLWQPTNSTIASAGGPIRWLLRGTYFLGILGFVWGIRSLRAFDGFGTGPILAKIDGKTPVAAPLTIRGPYRWVRHPLYSFALLLLWSFPDLTPDRLLLNFSWTIWIFVGSVLEERDLVSEYGESYREYQRRTPMLLPLRLPQRT